MYYVFAKNNQGCAALPRAVSMENIPPEQLSWKSARHLGRRSCVSRRAGAVAASRAGFEPLKLDFVIMRHQGRAPFVSRPVAAERCCGQAAQWELMVFFFILSLDTYKIHKSDL